MRDSAAKDLDRLDRRWNCKITTIGRRSGEPRPVTIWFVLDGGTLYLTGSKDEPHWCRNLRANGDVEVEIAGRRFRGRARVVADASEGQRIRQRFVEKYCLARLSRIFGGYTRSVPVVVELSNPKSSSEPASRDLNS